MDKNFLLKVWKLQEPKKGYHFCIATLHAKSKKWEDHFFEWPIKEKDLIEFENNYSQEKYNVYFCPTPFQIPQRKKSFVIGSKLLWADLDDINPKDCEIIPQIAWKSSDERFASLWILDKFYDSATVEQRNKALSYNIGADKGGWDLSQVLRMPGTLNHKYTPTSKVRQLWFKNSRHDLSEFPTHIYQNLDPQGILEEYRSKLKPSTVRLLTSKRASQGKRSEVIWKLNNEMAEQGISAQIRFNLLKGSIWNKFAGRHDEETQLMREVEKVESVKILTVEKDVEQPKVVCMSSVDVEEIDWLWYPYIALKKVTLLEGDPGLGKSWFTMALAAHISANRKLPGATSRFEGKVLVMSAEDGLGDTIRPRLDKLEANIKKVFAYATPVYLDEDGAAEIEAEIEKIKPSLVIVDPIVSYMGGTVDMNRANEVREIMNRLAHIAVKTGCAILAVRHHNKSVGGKAIHKGQGSVDFSAATRSILMVGPHPEDSDIRCVVHIKNNLGPKAETIEYSLDNNRKSIFRFEGLSYVTEDQVLNAKNVNDNKQEKAEAEKFLVEALKKKSVDQNMLFRDCEAAGISRKTLKLVSEKLDIRKIKMKGKIKWLFT